VIQAIVEGGTVRSSAGYTIDREWCEPFAKSTRESRRGSALSEKVVPDAIHPPSTAAAFSRLSVVRGIDLDCPFWIDLSPCHRANE
jgi:hypothetical protein